MSEILSYVITGLISMLTTGGIGGIFFWKQNVRLKNAEAKAAEVDVKSNEISNLAKSNDEWIRLYKNKEEENIHLEGIITNLTEKLEESYRSKDSAWERYSESRLESSKKDLVISELNWYRCEVNGCPYRKPPRKYGDMDFPKDGVNPIENPDPNVL